MHCCAQYARQGFPNITFTHVPREKNTDADRLANEAMDGA
ncbi:reverse transcriptase-like protein [Patescibacteria group bacterium]|nr:reverse transcriptase-like protein [Patescibacteria group bacterium]